MARRNDCNKIMPAKSTNIAGKKVYFYHTSATFYVINVAKLGQLIFSQSCSVSDLRLHSIWTMYMAAGWLTANLDAVTQNPERGFDSCDKFSILSEIYIPCLNRLIFTF